MQLNMLNLCFPLICTSPIRYCSLSHQVDVRWSAATAQEHALATRIQSIYRGSRAKRAAVRAAEYLAWYRDSAHLRSLLLRLCYFVLALLIAALFYLNLVYGIMFDVATCKSWLWTVLATVAVDACIQQPVVVMVGAVLGDQTQYGSYTVTMQLN